MPLETPALLDQMRVLRERMEEAEQTLLALRNGEVDAIVVSSPNGDRVYTLKGADEPYRVLVQGMAEGAVTLTRSGLILFANEQFASLVGAPLEQVMGARLLEFIEAEDNATVAALLHARQRMKSEVRLQSREGKLVPVYLSVSPLPIDGIDSVCMVVTDLTEQKRNEELVAAERLARSILDQSIKAILVTDMEGVIIRASGSADELAGTPTLNRAFDQILQLRNSSGDNYSVRDILQNIRQGRPVRDLELTARTTDNCVSELLLDAGPLRGSDTHLLGCVIGLTDITERKRLEEQAARRADEMKILMEALPAYVWISQDPHCEKITGNKSGNAVSAMPTRTMELAVSSAAPVRNIEMDFQLPEGRRVRALGNAIPLFDSESQVRGCIAAFVDITDRKKAEEALQESYRRLSLHVDNSPLAVVEWDSNFRITRWAGEAERVFGWNAAEVVGKRIDEFALVYNEDISLVNRVMVEMSGGSRPSNISANRNYRKDGSVIHCEWYNSSIHDADGGLSSVLSQVLDVTERRLAEESLRASEDRFRRLYDADIIGIVAADGDIILEANGVFLSMVGFTREDLDSGRIHWQDFTAPAHRQVRERAIQELIATGSCKPHEMEFLRHDGGRIPVMIGATLIQREPLTWLGFVIDLTERKSLERKLFEKQKLESIGLLAGGIAHDFNNLLVGILGNASLAQEMVPPTDESAEILDEIVKAGERAAHLTRQLLAYSGKGRFVVEQVDLSIVTQDMTKLLHPSIGKKINVHLDMATGLPPVEADIGQIEQVVMNLVLNASEAIGEAAGSLHIQTGTRVINRDFIRDAQVGASIDPGTYVFLEVRDTGCGIDEATATRIFDPFFTTKFTGRGLGLAAVAGILRSHKGAIRVVSKPGKGSTFVVLFPPGEGEIQPRETAATLPRAIEREPGGSETVLVVDDEMMVLRTAKLSLERKGHKVFTAESGRAAIETFRQEAHRISLVLLDLSMPEMSGHEVLPELRKVRPDVKVLVTSGYSEDEMARLFSGQNVSAFLQKPYTASLLAEKVRAALTVA